MHQKKVAFVARHCCIRVSKEAVALAEKGYSIHLLTHRQPHFPSAFRTITVYEGASEFFHSVKLLAPSVELFHCHNEPSWFVSQIKAVCDKPVILDVHDSLLLRIAPGDTSRTRISVSERDNFRLADGLVYVCVPMKETLEKEFGLTQPSAIVPSACPKSMYRYDAYEWKGGVVFEGRVDDVNLLTDQRERDVFEYCDYRDLCKEFMIEGLPFYVFPGGYEKMHEPYKDICLLQPTTPIQELIRCLGRHDWGFCGNLTSFPEWEQGLPNKMFEYIAAGIPVVCMNAGETSKFVEKHKVGITVKSVAELKERWNEHIELRKNVVRVGRSLSMENYIDVLPALYEEVLNAVK